VSMYVCELEVGLAPLLRCTYLDKQSLYLVLLDVISYHNADPFCSNRHSVFFPLLLPITKRGNVRGSASRGSCPCDNAQHCAAGLERELAPSESRNHDRRFCW
jgi:hypothetical protein